MWKIMKDRYLFKAKRVDNGEWVEGSLITCEDGTYKIATSYIDGDTNMAILICAYDVVKDTICQCTGLKDINGKLIWENDVVLKSSYTDYDYYAYSKAYIGLIQYEDAGWSVKAIKPDGRVYISPIIEMIANSKDIEHFEVIGNIFDNPELLESEG